MPAPSSISVLMPLYNGERFLPRVLEALAGQEIEIPWDLTVVDCGSTDSTLEILERFADELPVPLRRFDIEKDEFDHGDTRNLLAGLSRGEILVFLTDDAIPASRDWLATLIANFDEPAVGGAYCRNVPRPEADLPARTLSRGDPNYAAGRREVCLPPPEEFEWFDPYQRRILYSYCDTASAMRRSLWERHPYPRCRGAEDLLMARALLHAGYTVVYDDRAIVQHTHEFDLEQTTARARVDGEINAEWFDRVCVAAAGDIEVEVRAHLPEDRRELEEAGLEGDALTGGLLRAEELRRAHFQGLLEGGRTKRRRPPSWMRSSGRVAVLFLVDGNPASRGDGEERYAWNLARRLVARGHRCVLAGVETGDGPVSYVREELDGLATFRLERNGSSRDGEARRFPSPARALEEVIVGEEIELIHVLDSAVLDSLQGTPADHFTLPIVFTAAESDPTTLWKMWLEACPLVICPTRSVHDALLQATAIDRDLLVYSPGCDRPDEITDGDLVRWEYRYRALLCIDRDPPVLLDVPGLETVERAGELLEQGFGTLFLSGDGAAAEYELSPGLGGERELVVHVPCFQSEARLLFGGRVLVDGEELAVLGPFTGGGLDEVRRISRRFELPVRARRLRIETRHFEGIESSLRLARVEVRRPRRGSTRPGEVLLDRSGTESDATTGTVTIQGVDAALLGPGPAAIEYDLAAVGRGPREVEVHVSIEADEPLLALGGRILVDGLPLGRFGPVFSRGRYEVRAVTTSLVFSSPPRWLRLENVLRDPRRPVFLRVKHAVVRVASEPPSVAARLGRRLALGLRKLLKRPMKLSCDELS